MLTINQPKIMTTSNVVEVISKFRQEWEQTVEGQSLIEVKGSVGLMLFDLVVALALICNEQVQVLGSTLYQELQDMLEVIPENGKGL